MGYGPDAEVGETFRPTQRAEFCVATVDINYILEVSHAVRRLLENLLRAGFAEHIYIHIYLYIYMYIIVFRGQARAGLLLEGPYSHWKVD